MARVTVGRAAAVSLLLAAALCLGTRPAHAAGVFRVNAASTAETPDGATWESAYKTLQEGADAAEAAGGGEVWVARGVYTGSSYCVVNMTTGVSLYGGFSGGETTLEQRNWVVHASIIDGENSRQCVYCASSGTFDGFVLTHGKASSGGGMYVSTRTSPIIAHCVFVQNRAEIGGGMCNAGTPTVTNCVFKQNEAIDGYGADGEGGGFHNADSSNTTSLRFCTFSANRAVAGGGVYIERGSPGLTSCILWGNTATTGAQIQSSSTSYSPRITQSCVEGGFSGTGNVGTNPLFVDPAGLDSLRLKLGSPCIDKGVSPGGVATDLLGQPRVVNAIPDMGAYEGGVDTADIVTLTVTVSPAQGGRTAPAAEVQHLFGPGEPVMLSAQPLGYQFEGWTGSLNSTEQTTSFVISYNAAVTANFSENIVRVNCAQAGPADGETWATAYRTIQEGVNAADGGGEVWVAQGCYAGTGNIGLDMHPGVNIYGSFAGNEVLRTQRDLASGASVIDGEGLNRCVNGADDSTLDGFVIARGHATYGAGMWNYDRSPRVVNCDFTANTATTSIAAAVYGYRSQASFANCTFSRNRSNTAGGAIGSNSSDLELVNCTFSGNSAEYGGAVYSYGGGTATITNCVLWGDSGRTGPEIYNNGSLVSITYSCVQGGGTGKGNISSDPLLVDGAGGSLQLREGSPCADTGTDSAAPSTDRLGRFRFSDSGVDMGAHEGTATAGDIVTLNMQMSPVNGGLTEPEPGPHQHVRGETVPLSALAMGLRFATWAGDASEASPTTTLLMDSAKTVTAVFADNIIHVDAASGAFPANGASWASAFRTLQEGVDAAAAAGGGQVWVAAGTYTSANAQVLAMKPCIFVYGGFSRAETTLSQRNWHTQASVIDGENARRGVSGEEYALLDGFTITRGASISANPYEGSMGGGMLNNRVSPTVRNCTFMDNQATGPGAAIYSSEANTKVEYCTFQTNKALLGGRYSSYEGGAIGAYAGSLSLVGCTFTGNSTEGSGGAFAGQGARLEATNCVFTMNTAAANGGALWDGSYSSGSSVMNCTFSENRAGGSGGAISSAYSFTVTNSIFWNDWDYYGASEIDSSAYDPYGAESVTYSCVKGGFAGAGNIDTDPMFVGDTGGSVQLRPGSPCLDAGTGAGAPPVDVLDRPRPAGAAVDMGAYEGAVDPADMVALIVQISPEGTGRTWPPVGTHYFVRGETVTLSAGGTGFMFAGWSGAVNSTAPTVSLAMDGDKSITAEFEPFVAYVDAAATGGGDGSSWVNAFSSLQAAVDAVAAAGGGELWVTSGTYTAATEPVLTMKPGVFLFGGFAGTETTRAQRDWSANATVIDGEYARRCVVGADDARLDGFTITRGAAGYSYGYLYGDGGGMYNVRQSPTVAHCMFTENAGRNGGGMYNEDNTAIVVDCRFIGNFATEYGVDTPNFQYNHEYSYGGGMYNEVGAQTITGCTFEENVASLGSGMFNGWNTPTVDDCAFKENIVEDYRYGGSGYPIGGGGMANIDASAKVYSCIFKGNTHSGYDDYYKCGGAILNVTLDDYYYAPPQGQTLVVNTVFLNNSVADRGGAVCNFAPSVSISNCTFMGNEAGTGSSVYNGTSYYYPLASGDQPTMTNCVVKGAKNTTSACIADYFAQSSASAIRVTYSCVYGGYAGTGNIDADPLFADVESGDVRLSAGSPCIDSGTAEGAPAADILGIRRPQGAGFDMGAYEYDATPPNAPVVTGPGAVVNTPRPTFTWSSGGNAGAGLYRCGFAEGFWLIQESADTTFTPYSDLSDGRYILYVQERDAAGNWSASGSCTFILDTVAPNAPVINGAASPAMNRRPTWAWNSGGGGVHLYRWGFAEGLWLAEATAEATFTPQEDLANGAHTLYVQERDAAGNWSLSGAFTVTVDATAPNAPVVTGVPSPTANALPVWTWAPGGGDGIGQYRFGFAEGEWLAENTPDTAFTPGLPLADGSHTLLVQERDAAGNWSAPGSFTVTVDTAPPGAPVVSATVSPPNGARPTWTWMSAGDGGAGLFRFGYAEGVWIAQELPVLLFAPGTDLADGRHTLFVQERDAAGNWGASGSATVTVSTVVYHTVTVQTVSGGAISLDPAQPEGGYAHGTAITVRATADEGHDFTNWTGDLGGTAQPAMLVVDADKTVGAVFTATPAEGEGEGEVPPPVTDEEAAQGLTEHFDAADGDGSGALSAAEAMAAVPGMTAEQFARLDSDGDGRLTENELEAVLCPETGCACHKAAFNVGALRQRLGDLFLLGLGMMTLLAVRGKKP